MLFAVAMVMIMRDIDCEWNFRAVWDLGDQEDGCMTPEGIYPSRETVVEVAVPVEVAEQTIVL